jgi:hypothetical protein
LPTPPGPPTRSPVVADDRRPKIFLGIMASLFVAVVGTLVVLMVARSLDDSEREVEALGAAIEEPSEVLAEAERKVGRTFDLADGGDAVAAASNGGVSCWFSYPEGGDEPNDFLRCGPVAFPDSDPGTFWLEVPVSFQSRGDVTIADVGRDVAARTWALPPEEDLVRPDGALPPDEVALERPRAQVAESGMVGESERLMVDLDEVEDGRIMSVGHEAEVLAYTTTDRVMIHDVDRGQPAVYEAAEGEEWLVFQATAERHVARVDVEYTVAVGDDRLQLDELSDAMTMADEARLRGASLPPMPEQDRAFVASVPVDADDVSLSVKDDAVEQFWSFTEQKRSDDAPDVLYQDDRVADVDQTQVLPYGKQDLFPIPGSPAVDLGEYGSYEEIPASDYSIPFGEREVSIEIAEVRLDYAVLNGVLGDGRVFTASGPDRALLYLSDVTTIWSGDDFYDPYRVGIEDVVLTLDDGTVVEPNGGSTDDLRFNGPTHDGGGPASLMGRQLFWDVPADIESATLTISPSDRHDTQGWFNFEFQGGSVSFDLKFD